MSTALGASGQKAGPGPWGAQDGHMILAEMILFKHVQEIMVRLHTQKNTDKEPFRSGIR